MFRSELIREVETDLHAARARGMIKTPKFAGQTYQQVKAARYRRNQVYKAWAVAVAILTLVALAVGMVLL